MLGNFGLASVLLCLHNISYNSIASDYSVFHSLQRRGQQILASESFTIQAKQDSTVMLDGDDVGKIPQGFQVSYRRIGIV